MTTHPVWLARFIGRPDVDVNPIGGTGEPIKCLHAPSSSGIGKSLGTLSSRFFGKLLKFCIVTRLGKCIRTGQILQPLDNLGSILIRWEYRIKDVFNHTVVDN